ELDSRNRERPDAFAASVLDVQRIFLRLEQNRPLEAVEIIRRWVTLFPGLQAWECAFIMALSRAGHEKEAHARFRVFAEAGFNLQPDWHWLWCTALLAEASATIRDRDTASVLYERLAPYGDHCATIGAACVFLGSIQRHLGLLADVAERPALAH